MATIKGKEKKLIKAIKVAEVKLSSASKKKLKKRQDAQPVSAVAV